jgi:hypothetical protein
VDGQVVSVMGTGFTSDSRLYVHPLPGGLCRVLNTSFALCPLPWPSGAFMYTDAYVISSGDGSNILRNAVQYIPQVSCTSVHLLICCIGPLQAPLVR